jgi:CheY-like chemotaxis protein
MIEGVLETLGPLVQRLDVAVERDIPQDLPPVTVQRITMRQALFSVIAAAVSRVPGGRIVLSAGHGARQVSLVVTATPGASATPPADAAPSADKEQRKSLEVARRLIEVSGGSLALHPGELFQVRAALPAVDQVAVLGIDDNSDTLRLLQKYLSGTRYRFVGTTDPRQALPLAEQWAPRVILLDVMLPEIDGWELLSRLREHPRTQHTPIVVCTVLPQPDLASLLGAAAFLSKPFSQETLLATLDRYANAAGARGAL